MLNEEAHLQKRVRTAHCSAIRVEKVCEPWICFKLGHQLRGHVAQLMNSVKLFLYLLILVILGNNGSLFNNKMIQNPHLQHELKKSRGKPRSEIYQ